MPSRCLLLFALATRSRLPGLLLATLFLLGADDDYLREIEEEAKRQAAILITSQSQSTPTPPPAAPSDASTDRLAAGLDAVNFEQALRQRSPEVFTLYQQLDNSRKQQVYQTYQNDSQLASISERINQLLDRKP